jgi:hypothetical protein
VEDQLAGFSLYCELEPFAGSSEAHIVAIPNKVTGGYVRHELAGADHGSGSVGSYNSVVAPAALLAVANSS